MQSERPTTSSHDRRCHQRRVYERRGNDRRCHEWRRNLVAANVPLALHLAGRFTRRDIPRDDLNQVATVGLCLAAQRFDPTHGRPFVSYAVPMIVGTLKHYFRDCTWDVAVPRRLKDAKCAMDACASRLPQDLGRTPNPGEIARAMGVDRATYEQTRTVVNSYRAQMLSTFPSDEYNLGKLGCIDHQLGEVLDALFVTQLLAELDGHARDIIVLTYWDGVSQDEIAQRLHVSQMHVSRVLRKSLALLRSVIVDGRVVCDG